ncbi:MAG: class GN sortase [Hyphomicrobiaceae bacterium]
MPPFSPLAGVKGWRPSPRAMAALAIALLGATLVGQAAYIHAKAILAQILLDRAFAATIASGTETKPWSWADTWPVARIAVPRLSASAIALAGSSGQALAFGPGHVEGTAEPGDPGTAVYAAHRDTHFAFLQRVVVGDIVEVTGSAGAINRYRVTRLSVAPWKRADIDPAAAGRHLVLATCWPFDARTPGPLRYLVHADLVEPETGPADQI